MKLKKAITTVLMISALSISFVYADTPFRDVEIEWQITPVQWASQNKIVQGYPDGTFLPENAVTEAEFATMLARYAKNVDYEKLLSLPNNHWSQHIYNELAKYKLPFKGYNSNDVKDTPVTRGTIAQIIAAKNGFDLSLEESVEYMYENDLSNGKGTVKDFENYDAYGPMKRAEAAAFLNRLSDANVTTFKGVPSSVNADEILGIVSPVYKTPDNTNEAEFLKIGEEIAKKYGYEIDKGKESFQLDSNEGERIIMHGKSNGSSSFKYNIKNNDVSMEDRKSVV